MNPFDRWREILDVMLRRKLRTALTALAVAWGIFMLVVLLAAGNGLAEGAEHAFARDALNSIWVNPGVQGKPFQGNPVGRRVGLDEADHPIVRAAVPLEDSSTQVSVGERPVSRAARQGSFPVDGVGPAWGPIEGVEITRGRGIDAGDLQERRKVAAIGKRVAASLFADGEDPVGTFLRVGNAVFRVVGVFQDPQDDRTEETIAIPRTTARAVFATGPRVDSLALAVEPRPVREVDGALREMRRRLGGRKGFAGDDERALRVWNNFEMTEKLHGLFAGIRWFVWLIGLGTILAGIVGVGNIMLISVAERTREFGIRKAVGATPASIVRMVVEEALVVTMVAGYLGLVAAVGLVELAGRVMPPDLPYFTKPQVDLRAALGATAVLVAAGVLAGFFPALRAARVVPMAALRVE